jgi:predicted amidohydrolase
VTVVAAVTLAGSYDVAANLAAHHALLTEAADAGAELVVFPECSLHGYPDQGRRASAEGRLATWQDAEPVGGPRSAAVLQHAADRGVHVVFGLNEATGTAGVIHNTAVLGGPQGLVGAYRKVHLGQHERSTWTPGTSLPVWTTPLGRIGLMICGDLAVPETARELALGGAELLVLPTAWAFPDTGVPRWGELYRLFCRARAAENACWLVTSNYVGPLGDTCFPGGSSVVDPAGTVLHDSDGAGVLLADLDLRGGIATAHAGWALPRLVEARRPQAYPLLRTGPAAPAPPGHITG